MILVAHPALQRRLPRGLGLLRRDIPRHGPVLDDLSTDSAIGMAHRPAAGLAITDTLEASGALRAYHLLPSARAVLLMKLGRRTEAGREFGRAASLTHTARERTLLEARAAACARERDSH